MNNLINKLIKEGHLKNDLIIEAFCEINRIDFVGSEMENESEKDLALPIGYGQTISQPAVVAFMLELLSPCVNDNVLDVGSGSGWTTALLSYIVGENGKVFAVEKNCELMKIGERNVNKYSYVKKRIANFYCADGKEGLLENSPYDKILVSASSTAVPQMLKEQLKIGGRMVIPIENSLVFIERKSEDDFFEKEYPGFSFVLLT